MVLADLPFGSYGTKEAAYDNAVTLMRPAPTWSRSKAAPGWPTPSAS